MLKRFFYLLMLISLQLSCDKNTSVGENKFSDPVLVKIYEFKDRRLSDSLYQFFISESPVHRKEAILAFASIQDSTSVNNISKALMREVDSTLRVSMAFTLGQIHSHDSERILLGYLTKKHNPEILKASLEAYGKATKQWQLIHTTFEDTARAEGLAWSIYRAGFNGKTDSSVNAIAAFLLNQKYNVLTQLGAAHFFSRSAKDFEKEFKLIALAAQKDSSPEVRMAAVSALRKIKTQESFQVITTVLKSESDYRVRVNAVKALQAFPIADTKSSLYATLYDKNINVGIAASEVIKANSTNENWIELSNLTGRIQNWRIQANLYEAALNASDNKSLANEIETAYKQSINPFQKAALLTALQSNTTSFNFIEQQLLAADTPVVRTSAASALVAMNYKKNFDPKLKIRFADLCEQLMKSGDPAVVGILANALADSTLNYKKIVKDFTFLYDARKTLSLPKDNESLQTLEAAIAYFENKKVLEIKNEFNHPIDWEFVKGISKDQKVIIKTSRGHITLRLLVEEAPGSVSNFLKLAQMNYFDKKVFHRVVPNFVIQAGCNRGDGYGGEDYSIRSEFSPRKYKAGSVGMASAGKDTEGTQWFITHSPTPHLDGRYTIFAEVIEGMEAVHLIEVGDQIIDVEIVKDNKD